MNKRLYSLYSRPLGGKRWTRVSPYAYTKNLAIRVFQSRLLDCLLSGNVHIEQRLRVVTKFDKLEAK